MTPAIVEVVTLVTFINIDEKQWRADGGQQPFLFEHGYAGDERLTKDRIAELAAAVPPADIETNPSKMELLSVAEGGAIPDRPIEEIARKVVELERWLAVHNIEQIPEYRRLLDEGLDSADRHLGLGSRMIDREGYIILSAVASVTPAHIDHEHNLLLQIEGTKELTVGGFPDAGTEHELLEAMHSGKYGRTGFEAHDPKTFTMVPGTGVYIPPRAVHSVFVRDNMSISLSLVFVTEELRRIAQIYGFNARLRRMGLTPRPPGTSATADRVKSSLMRVLESAQRAKR